MTTDIIRMAREAHGRTTGEWWDMDVAALERFAALVAAPLQERIQDLYKQLNEAERELDSQYKLGMEVEREQCAKLVEGLFDDTNDSVLAFIVDAIRARGQDA